MSKLSKLTEFENKLNALSKEFEELKKKLRRALEIGEVVEVAGMEWTILDKTDVGYFAITTDFDSLYTKFDEYSNNWKNSNLRNYLNTEFLKKVESNIGRDVLPEFERDLLSLDGLTEYGKCMDKVSLLTADEYREYRRYLPRTNQLWWLCTPWSTPRNDYERTSTLVSPYGHFDNNVCFEPFGVRPCCIFPYAIFESEDE